MESERQNNMEIAFLVGLHGGHFFGGLWLRPFGQTSHIGFGSTV